MRDSVASGDRDVCMSRVVVYSSLVVRGVFLCIGKYKYK